MMNSSSKIALAVTLSTLGGCGGGASVGSNNGAPPLASPNNILSNSIIPASLTKANDRKISSGVVRDDPAASSNAARISLIDMGAALSDLQPAHSTGFSQNALLAGSGYMEDRLLAVSDDWRLVEGVLDQITEQCQSIADGQNCEVQPESLSWAGDLRGDWVSAVNFKQNGETYAHELSVDMNNAGVENSLSFLWDEAKAEFLTISAGSWDQPTGTYNSRVLVSGYGDEQEIRIDDTVADEMLTYSESQHLTQLSDGIRITGSTTVTTDTIINNSTSEYIANSDGGISTISFTFTMDGTTFQSHIKEFYALDGTTEEVLFCDEGDGTDCTDESAWMDITFPFIDESQLCPDDLPEGAVCDLPLIAPVDIDETTLCPDDLPEGAVCDTPVDPTIVDPTITDETTLCPDDLPEGAVCDTPVDPTIVDPTITDETTLCPDDLPEGAVCDTPVDPIIVDPTITDETTLCPDDLPEGAVCDAPVDPTIVDP